VTQQDPAPAASPAPGATGGTGDPRVDDALRKLADLADLPVHQHPAVFGEIHEALAGALGTLDPAAGPADRAAGR
jgi:hypothetical protein